ncbi:hypothetical protein BKA62DRAFT_38376 [Auriculariales sp. MPI-PUGE-AT-0066]|nr:hypothetical protein BKA62DRAFT_38376 [Auriculariales sp. MPI-PUGE-AT-0066]
MEFRSNTCAHQESAKALISPFVFSAAAGSDTVSVNGLKDVSASHNTDTRRIRLEIHRVHILEGNTRPKEVSSAQLRETVWHAPSYRVQPRDPLDSAPWVVFEFKYMSRDELKHVHRQLRPTFHSTRRAVSSPNTFSNLIPAANLRQKGLFNIGTRREHYALLGIESPARPAKKARHNIMYSGN